MDAQNFLKDNFEAIIAIALFVGAFLYNKVKTARKAVVRGKSPHRHITLSTAEAPAFKELKEKKEIIKFREIEIPEEGEPSTFDFIKEEKTQTAPTETKTERGNLRRALILGEILQRKQY